jgi:PhzF family phenazine biosynthesis protein
VLVPITHVDVFASSPGGGNPCPVITEADQLTGHQMQAVAAHCGHESGFALRDPDGTLRLRYFVPRHEMSMCVHATVAAVSVLAEAGRLDSSTFVVRTASGECAVTCSDGRPMDVTVEQQPPTFGPALELDDALAAVLGLGRDAVDRHRTVRAVSVSRPKLIVPLRRAADVHACAPTFDALWALCRSVDATGAYVFAPHDSDEQRVVARQFPVEAGYPEDPATGVAAGALAAYLADESGAQGWLRIDIDQGDAMGRPSRISAAAFADADGVRRSTVTGRATIVGTELLDLDAIAAPAAATELR